MIYVGFIKLHKTVKCGTFILIWIDTNDMMKTLIFLFENCIYLFKKTIVVSILIKSLIHK